MPSSFYNPTHQSVWLRESPSNKLRGQGKCSWWVVGTKEMEKAVVLSQTQQKLSRNRCYCLSRITSTPDSGAKRTWFIFPLTGLNRHCSLQGGGFNRRLWFQQFYGKREGTWRNRKCIFSTFLHPQYSIFDTTLSGLTISSIFKLTEPNQSSRNICSVKLPRWLFLEVGNMMKMGGKKSEL